MEKIKTLIVFGTRPDAIKMVPLIDACKASDMINPCVCSTGQHREMLEPVLRRFRVEAQYQLDIMQPAQTLSGITTRVLQGMDGVMGKEKPDIVLVHGDTTTGFAAALSAFYHQVPVGHVEAGLRTYQRYSPYPEEMNRLLMSSLSTLHFAPTRESERNLRRECVKGEIYCTGNTAIDVLRYTVAPDYRFLCAAVGDIPFSSRRVVLVTAHRRENVGEALVDICRAVRRLAERYEDIEVVFPVHMNPSVRTEVYAQLGGLPRVRLVDPLDVFDLHNLLSRCTMVLTDSGGIQEEACALRRPTLVLRRDTERPEALRAHSARLAGTQEQPLFDLCCRLLDDSAFYASMAGGECPFGDGYAAEKIVRCIIAYFQGKALQGGDADAN